MTTKYPVVLHLTRGQIAMLRRVAAREGFTNDDSVSRLMKLVEEVCTDPPKNAPERCPACGKKT